MISCQSDDKFKSHLISHTHEAWSPPSHLISLCFFKCFIQRGTQIRPTDKRAKSKQSKIPSKWRPNLPKSGRNVTSTKPEPSHTIKRNSPLSHSQNLPPGLEPDEEAVIASSLRQKSTCSGARCCLNNKCRPMSPFARTSQREEVRHVRAVITDIQDLK